MGRFQHEGEEGGGEEGRSGAVGGMSHTPAPTFFFFFTLQRKRGSQENIVFFCLLKKGSVICGVTLHRRLMLKLVRGMMICRSHVQYI